jgi:penicillin-binding protein 1A
MSPSPSAPPRNRSRWRLAAWLVAALALLPLMLLGIAGAMAWQQLPELSRLTDYQPKEPLRIHTSDGVLIGEFGTERRRFVPLDEIPKALQDALLAVEDAEFWTHPGLDFSGMLRAAWRNVTHSGPRHGASTITQQLAETPF